MVVVGSFWRTYTNNFSDVMCFLNFVDEHGKQVQSAIKIKNTHKFHVAFKFETTAPRSCFMRPPGAI
ncbi:putative major sperm protein (MSP) [Helianthus debilis subsp. tardiflorus]